MKKRIKLTPLAIFVTTVCAVTPAIGEDNSNTLDPIEITVQTNNNVTIAKDQIAQQQPRNLKALLKDQLDVQVNELQRSRAGNDSINIRGLQGNRVATTLDGIPLPETQENKLFVSLGINFGGLNTVEPGALRSAKINYTGSYRSLSGGVDLTTLDPSDLIRSGNVGGFVATGYDSEDNSIYGTIAGAVKEGRNQGLLLVSGRKGNETDNHGTVGGDGSDRTKPDPANYKNQYILVKNGYQFDDHNDMLLSLEHYYGRKTTDLRSSNGTRIDRATGTQIDGTSQDKNRRTRLSLLHEYQNHQGWINHAKTLAYIQNSKVENFRSRLSDRAERVESANTRQKLYGINSDLTTFVNTAIPQTLRYGLAFQYTDFTSQFDCPTCSSNETISPMANSKQIKAYVYLEDEFALGNFVIKPHLGMLYYHHDPSTAGYKQIAEEYAPVKNQNKTALLPKLSLNWKINALFEPYFQYSRGIKTPSAQQFSSSFGNSGVIRVGSRQISYAYAVIGNPNLKPETAHNFNLGIKGHHKQFQYDIAAYYNKYKHFIDWKSRSTPRYNPLVQYQNLDSAKIYGVTANAKWKFIDPFYISGGIAYTRGNAKNNAEKTPINTVQPLKLQAGLGYEGERFGGNISLTHIRAKADKDIEGTIYNPTYSVNLVDIGAYWRPLENLLLTANITNLFNRKYWNWADISYFAVQSSSSAADRTLALNHANADAYSAPGRNFNIGVRYEF
ncbi:TonB-dependent hemoglobin/transferrin/lactoferrin family receptor [Actinobacillus seminis]|uniref:TonB-dependent hemoglobin/transferrin/lactoferrin family receptor n=1 Tax=Actinobacillus seminis TaxID=722 RepID=UPI003B9561FB